MVRLPFNHRLHRSLFMEAPYDLRTMWFDDT